MKPSNPHFRLVDSIDAAQKLLSFRPREPSYTAGCDRESVAVFVMDHRKRPVDIENRTAEMHFGRFVVSQQAMGPEEAIRRVFETSYGRAGEPVMISDHEGVGYELGPPVPDDDIDGRGPAVLVWFDGEVFHLVASDELDLNELVRIARSIG